LMDTAKSCNIEKEVCYGGKEGKTIFQS